MNKAQLREILSRHGAVVRESIKPFIAEMVSCGVSNDAAMYSIGLALVAGGMACVQMSRCLPGEKVEQMLKDLVSDMDAMSTERN